MIRHLVVAALAGLAQSGCKDLHVYSFEGQRYDDVGQCLGPESVIDIVQGYAEGTCQGVRCFEGDDGSEYVSASCKAPPHFVDVTSDRYDRKCILAMRAYTLGKAGACPSG
jgi:hypothetical protein